jgi:hypothetical protein
MPTQRHLEALEKRGWRLIVSEAQAHCLLRREIKQARAREQRNGVTQDMDFLLAIKVGTWFKFLLNYDGTTQLMIWRTH